MPTIQHVIEFVKGLVVPSLSLLEALAKAYPENSVSNMSVAVTYGVLYYTWFAIFVASAWKKGLVGIGWTIFLAAGVVLMSVRSGFRERYNIRSNEFTDLFGSLFFWPQVVSQMNLFDEEKANRAVAAAMKEAEVLAAEKEPLVVNERPNAAPSDDGNVSAGEQWA